MLPEQLSRLIEDIQRKKCEMQHIEIKKAERGTPERLYDTLSSFSNQAGGGIIIFGLCENDGYSATGVYDAQDIQVQVTNQALQMQPIVRPVFTVTDVQDKVIVSAEIAECEIYDKPCFYKGAGRMRGSYIRVGESDQPMTEYEIYSYEAFKRKIHDELRIVERASMMDLGQDALTAYLIKLRLEKPNLAKQTNERILQFQGITDQGRPTVAGIMLLGEYPQAFFPQLSITAMVVAGTAFGVEGQDNERFIDNKRIEGTIPQMLEDAMAFVRRNTRTATIIDQDGKRADRTEYPLKAVREIILNALIHRDYSIHTDGSPIRIILFSDRIEVENPGGLYGRITLSDLGKVSADTRNPYIAGALEIMIDTENRFSGIPTIMHEMAAAGLRPPLFENRRGVFKVTLFNEFIRKTDIEGIPVDSENLAARILAYCTEPRSREELAAYLQIKSSHYAISRYVKPLVDRGLIRLTMPEVPRSKRQKFVVAGIK